MSNLLDVKNNLLPNLKKLYNFFMYASCVAVLVALIMYLTGSKTQYNAQSLAPVIIVSGFVAMGLYIVSIVFDIRFLKYCAAIALLMAFLQFVITEINFYSNWIIATDPVAQDVINYYMTVTVLLFISTALSFVSAAMCKKAYYAEEKAKEAQQ
ncbi:MAG: hypothetical protein ILP02_01700 [Clostridia bacterium]|nr:hypothetical protein [Clostridia bacterium]